MVRSPCEGCSYRFAPACPAEKPEFIADMPALPTPPTIAEHGLNRQGRRFLSKLLKIPFKGSRWTWKTHVVKTWRDERGRIHNSHSHTFSVTSAAGSSHSHNGGTAVTSTDWCGDAGGQYHSHSLCSASYPTASEATHTHSLSGTTSTDSAVDLNHTHTISVTSGAGSTHRHLCTGWVVAFWSYCLSCYPNNHWHDTTGYTAYESTHTHTYSGTTGTGVGTLESHVHSLPTPTGTTASHSHGTSGMSVDSNTCDHGNNHGHPSPSGNWTGGSHNHAVSGNTAAGGEPPAAGILPRNVPRIGPKRMRRTRFDPTLRMSPGL